jgi:hypothetical protein
MHHIEPPLLAAISGAVSAYIQEEEAALAAAAWAQAPAPPRALNLWGLAGRQEAMQMRLLAQRRSLR